MMKSIARLLSVMLVLALLLPAACAETADDPVIALVNGEALHASKYAVYENSYMQTFLTYGADMTDAAVVAYVQDLALTTAIEDMLVEQDMRAQGSYAFDEETERWLIEEGNAAYEAALEDVRAMMRESLQLTDEEEITKAALAYAQELDVTEETYADFFRTQYATMNYYDWLSRDLPVTDEEIDAAYESNVAASKAQYENDIAAFETALSTGKEIWYTPEGYRSVLQILLPAQGENDQEKLESVKATTDTIYARLEAGETFESLIAEYGTDQAFENEAFYSTGYQVHAQSVVWETAFISGAFSEEMQAPGDVSQPFASTLGVHILYYLGDVPAGPVHMTQEIRDALGYSIYSSRVQKLLAERIDELAQAADVVMY